MRFSTEGFLDAVIEEVESRYSVDPEKVFTLSWSSSGPAAYAAALTEGSKITGSFVAMSVFKPDQLPSLKGAKGKAFYLLHSPDDFIPIRMAEDAEKQLSEKRAEVCLQTYEGGARLEGRCLWQHARRHRLAGEPPQQATQTQAQEEVAAWGHGRREPEEYGSGRARHRRSSTKSVA